MRKNGFTLIELLVVIAIIAILAAILFPVFAEGTGRRRVSRRASATSSSLAWDDDVCPGLRRAHDLPLLPPESGVAGGPAWIPGFCSRT
jgi:prepilin-type N-terminal cleavage/methylation domain-containing protein